jgi:thioesterase domain-containing protein
MRYVPKPYSGNVLVLRAKDEPFLRDNDPTLGWGRLVNHGLTAGAVKGDHMSLLVEPNVQDTAAQILDYLRMIRATE